MWCLLLLACSPPPAPTEAPAVLSGSWSELAVPVEGTRIVSDRDDSLVVRGPAATLSVVSWTRALEAQGWSVQASSSSPDLHAVRFVRGEDDAAEALVFAATRYGDRATHSLSRVEVP